MMTAIAVMAGVVLGALGVLWLLKKALEAAVGSWFGW